MNKNVKFAENLPVFRRQTTFSSKESKEKVMELQQELSKSSLKVSENLGEDLTSIMAGADQHDISPFIKSFWEEQQKYIKCSSREIRYRPVIIRFC